MAGVALVDSSVFIRLLRDRLDPATELTRRARELDLATCGMVRLEVIRGIKHPKVRERIEGFMDVMNCVPTDNRVWDDAAELAWQLDRRGLTLPAPDILIAACARRIEASVLTFDGHFFDIPGLPVFAKLNDLH
jgi:predicted nucleic acid-binding protein